MLSRFCVHSEVSLQDSKTSATSPVAKHLQPCYGLGSDMMDTWCSSVGLSSLPWNLSVIQWLCRPFIRFLWRLTKILSRRRGFKMLQVFLFVWRLLGNDFLNLIKVSGISSSYDVIEPPIYYAIRYIMPWTALDPELNNLCSGFDDSSNIQCIISVARAYVMIFGFSRTVQIYDHCSTHPRWFYIVCRLGTRVCLKVPFASLQILHHTVALGADINECCMRVYGKT